MGTFPASVSTYLELCSLIMWPSCDSDQMNDGSSAASVFLRFDRRRAARRNSAWAGAHLISRWVQMSVRLYFIQECHVTLMMHLSSGVSNSMVVTWTTVNETESVVEYGLWGGKLFSHTAKGNSSVFINEGPEFRAVYIHRVTLSQLTPAASYGNLHTCSWAPSDPQHMIISLVRGKHWVIIINILHFSTHYSTVLYINIIFNLL